MVGKVLDIVVDKNEYVINGKRYARVTRVLDIVSKPEFYRWFGKHGYEWCTEYRDSRAVFGTRLHKEFQNFLEDKSVWIDSGEMSMVFDCFREWVDGHVVVPEFLECHLFSDELGVAGTCDYIGLLDGRLVVLDWKTSKKVYDSYRVQVAVYLFMFEQLYGRVVDGGAGVLCFTKDGMSERFLSRDECLELVDVFRAMRVCYRWKYGR